MLEKKDIQKIGNIVEEKINNTVRKIIKPSFDDVYKRLDGIDTRLNGVDKRLDGLDKRLDGLDKQVTKIGATMVTKWYLDDKLADLEGSVIIRQRKQDKKVDLLIEFLKKKNILNNNEVSMLDEFQIFPSLKNLKKSHGK